MICVTIVASLSHKEATNLVCFTPVNYLQSIANITQLMQKHAVKWLR